MIDHISMDESWINGITSKPSFNLKKQITKYKEKRQMILKTPESMHLEVKNIINI